MRNKIVSVNITTFNRASLLPRCIEGVLSQSYKNLEINIVDDGSTDNTKEILEKYKSKDSRIRAFYHNINKGNAIARNTALNNTYGYYVAFLDDDDEWIDTNKIKKQVDLFEKDNSGNIGIICSNINYIDENNFKKPTNINKPKDLVTKILKGNGIIHNSTVMTKKEILDKVGGFDEKLKRGIDSDFYRSCIVKYKYKVLILNEITTNYYVHSSDRITLINNTEKLREVIKANKYLAKKYFKNYMLHPKALIHRIKKILKYYIQLIKI
jgi:glycosyltransferase involved in cell wall biosynthesis